MTKKKAKPKTRRQLQIGEVIRRLIAREIEEYVVDSHIDGDFLTIMHADISPDLRYCKVVYRCKVCNRDKYQKLLDGVANELSSVIYKRLKMRVRPEIRFIFDDVLLAIEEIERVVKKSREMH